MFNLDDDSNIDADDFLQPPRSSSGSDAIQLRGFVLDAITEGLILLFGVDPDGGLILLQDP